MSLIDLDRAIIRTGGKFDSMVERCYYRPVEREALVFPICALIPGDALYQCRGEDAVLAFLTLSPYPQLNSQTRLEKRFAACVHAAEGHAYRGEAISVVVGDCVYMDNHDGKAVSPFLYDASNERTLLASLVANGDLKLWERADSRILRGRRADAQIMNRSCSNCVFRRQTGSIGSANYDRWCHLDLLALDVDRAKSCASYRAAEQRPSDRFVRIKADDIWIPPFAERPQGPFSVAANDK
ncbi:hypothetical protein [Alicyclobacillus ferrooxydans]|uniref:Uncharacterized protein n=1 Tax=Alicyclobacillus ferrooxydans TaxID=471514 RepID=A0A0P9CRM6_9BACL|nr:hypothetical protein [Alicyclobacillus ferrooxydans]KPV45486.1 hypothetical protein AN477_00550 [Alicyclobacillus ferrooxydans]